jgi:hypothetical protein
MAAWSNDRERREVHKGWQSSVNFLGVLLFLALVVWMIWGRG